MALFILDTNGQPVATSTFLTSAPFLTPGSGEIKAAPLGEVPSGYGSVAQMSDARPMFVAHRGGSANWTELSLRAFTNSVCWGAKALEVSLGRTSDGVWFGLHDTTLDRTSGTTGANPAAMTWAEVQEHLIFGAEPYMRWEEIYEAYGSTHVLFVDPKDSAESATFRAEFVAMLAALDVERLVVKYYGPASWMGTQAKAAGLATWGYYYADTLTNVETNHEPWDFLGLSWDAPQAAWDRITAIGKPVLGHIVPSAAAAATALSKGAAGCMVANVMDVIPGPSVPVTY